MPSQTAAEEQNGCLAPREKELATYRAENVRLAKELDLARRALEAIPYTACETRPLQVHQARLLPRSSFAGDDILFHIDRCEAGAVLFEISGWAFCPRIPSTSARLYLILRSGNGALMLQPETVSRPDVVTAFASVDLGPELPAGPSARMELGSCGFACLLSREGLDSGPSYDLWLQIDGPTFSVSKATGIQLHG